MSAPEDCRFLESHEWHKADGETVTIGLSKFAVDELTDVTHVELPETGEEFSAGDSIGEIESVKSTNDLYTGVGGKVVETNSAVADDPSLVNNDPYGKGWLVKLQMSDPSELEKLMDAKTYDEQYPAS